MKYQLPSAKTNTAPQAKAPLDMQAAFESLNESFDAVVESYKMYVEAVGRVEYVEDVIKDSKSALESISKYGITAANMALLNEGNSLDKALGLENLAIESLESLSASTKAMLQQQYCKGLEGLNDGAKKTLWESIKAFFAKLIQWLKDFFTGTAKMIAIVKELKFEELDPNAELVVHSYEDCKSMLSAADQADKVLAECTDRIKLGAADTESMTVEEVVQKADQLKIDSFKKDKGKLSELKWTAQTAAEIQKEFIRLGTTNKMDANWKAIQAEYTTIIGKTGEATEDAEKRAKKAFGKWKVAGRLTGQYNKAMRAVGLTLFTLAKANKKAAAPAAPAEPAK